MSDGLGGLRLQVPPLPLPERVRIVVHHVVLTLDSDGLKAEELECIRLLLVKPPAEIRCLKDLYLGSCTAIDQSGHGLYEFL